jgi:predicted transcriptional regulator
MADDQSTDILTFTAEIVSAHVAHNHVSTGELAGLIASVHGALAGLGGSVEAAPALPEFTPATTIRKSLADPNRIISMIDGKAYATLKRHLTNQGLTPAEYRARYGLPFDYPITAPAYSERRRALAKSIGLGRKPGEMKAAKGTAPKRGGRKSS